MKSFIIRIRICALCFALCIFSSAGSYAQEQALQEESFQQTTPTANTQTGEVEGTPVISGSDIALVPNYGSEITALTARDIAFLLSPLLSLIGVGLIVYFTRRNSISEQWLKINQAEAEYLQNKLDKFYGPFILESEANHLMAQDLRSRQPVPEEYRLLDKLFDKKWRENLSPGDRALVEEICQTGERLAGVIKDNAGLVDAKILPYISRAIAHFRVLRLAYENKLGDNSGPFLCYVYPKSLDPVLELELNRLHRRMTLLRQNPTKSHGDLTPLDLNEYPLPKWSDPQRPDFDPASSTLIADIGPGRSLMSSRDGP